MCFCLSFNFSPALVLPFLPNKLFIHSFTHSLIRSSVDVCKLGCGERFVSQISVDYCRNRSSDSGPVFQQDITHRLVSLVRRLNCRGKKQPTLFPQTCGQPADCLDLHPADCSRCTTKPPCDKTPSTRLDFRTSFNSSKSDYSVDILSVRHRKMS